MHCTSHMGKRLLLLLLSIGCCLAGFAAESYTLRGRVIDRLTRRPVAYAAVVLDGQGDKGASTDSTGRFAIERVRPGIYRLAASCIGYRNTLTPEYVVSAATPLHRDRACGGRRAARRRDRHPHAVPPHGREPRRVAGDRPARDRKSPGANRDVSRIVRSYPGVSFSPVGYRNDLIVRGGGPSENVFYMDGIEIPNINHFATQGASGGPREHRQRRSGARDQFLHRAPSLPTGPERSVRCWISACATATPKNTPSRRRSAHRKCR